MDCDWLWNIVEYYLHSSLLCLIRWPMRQTSCKLRHLLVCLCRVDVRLFLCARLPVLRSALSITPQHSISSCIDTPLRARHAILRWRVRSYFHTARRLHDTRCTQSQIFFRIRWRSKDLACMVVCIFHDCLSLYDRFVRLDGRRVVEARMQSSRLTVEPRESAPNLQPRGGVSWSDIDESK